MTRADAGNSSIRREIAGKAVSSPISTCQSKPIGTTKEPRGPPMPSTWPGAARSAQVDAGSPCITKSMTSSWRAASK